MCAGVLGELSPTQQPKHPNSLEAPCQHECAPRPGPARPTVLPARSPSRRYANIAAGHAALALAPLPGGGGGSFASGGGGGHDPAAARHAAAIASDVATRFVRLAGVLFDRINLDSFPSVLAASMADLETLLSE